MNTLAEIPPRMGAEVNKPHAAQAPERTGHGGWLFWLLLLGYLLFAHGCHGDEDNELFIRLKQHIAGAID